MVNVHVDKYWSGAWKSTSECIDIVIVRDSNELVDKEIDIMRMQWCQIGARLSATIVLTIQWLKNVIFCKRHIALQPFNTLAPGRFQFDIRKVIFKLTLVNGGWCISYEIALRWMPQDLTGDKSTLVQVMVWCRHATSDYLSQCWPRSMPPNGVTRPQWVKKQCYRQVWRSSNRWFLYHSWFVFSLW